MEAGKLMSLRQIAQRWRCSYSMVRKWINQGRLVPLVLDGRNYLPDGTKRPKSARYGSRVTTRGDWPRK